MIQRNTIALTTGNPPFVPGFFSGRRSFALIELFIVIAIINKDNLPMNPENCSPIWIYTAA